MTNNVIAKLFIRNGNFFSSFDCLGYAVNVNKLEKFCVEIDVI